MKKLLLYKTDVSDYNSVILHIHSDEELQSETSVFLTTFPSLSCTSYKFIKLLVKICSFRKQTRVSRCKIDPQQRDQLERRVAMVH